MARALGEAGSVAASHKVLGSFPRALDVSSGNQSSNSLIDSTIGAFDKAPGSASDGAAE